jgi:hypothetical protein
MGKPHPNGVHVRHVGVLAVLQRLRAAQQVGDVALELLVLLQEGGAVQAAGLHLELLGLREQ